MKTYQRYTLHIVTTVMLSFACRPTCSAGGTTALDERVRSQDVGAIKEAGSQSRTDLVASLVVAANISAEPDEPVRVWAKAALAKLGQKKYLDEAIAELTSTNTDLFTFYIQNGICGYPSQEGRMACATKRTQEIAFGKLAYIRNPSTVKTVAQFLYSTEHYQFSADVPPWWASSAAIRALRQMVDNPPASDDVNIWQQWWEQNRDKYP